MGCKCKSPDEGLQLLKRKKYRFLLQINFNMMDIRAYQSGLLDLAYRKGVGIVARTPLCFGFLTGKITQNTIFPEGDHRHNWSSNQKKLGLTELKVYFLYLKLILISVQKLL